MATGDLFKAETAPAPAKAPESGLLVTNHLNLMYMLAAGLVMPPAGFGDKYYRHSRVLPRLDSPVHRKAAHEALESSTREAGHLKPIVLRIGLSGLSGNVVAIGDHCARELHFPDQLEGSGADSACARSSPHRPDRVDCVSVGPDRRACEADAKDFGNVPLADFKSRSGASKAQFTALFTRPRRLHGRPVRDRPPGPSRWSGSLAAGGVMAMLFPIRQPRGAGGARVPERIRPSRRSDAVSRRLSDPRRTRHLDPRRNRTAPRSDCARDGSNHPPARLSGNDLLGGRGTAGSLAGSRPRRKRGERAPEPPRGGLGEPGPAGPGRDQKAPRHPRIPDRTRGTPRQASSSNGTIRPSGAP